MITGKLTVIRDAEDLVGRFWFCPSCNTEILINNEGINHHCTEKKYWAVMNLEQIWDREQAYEAWEKREHKMWFKEIN